MPALGPPIHAKYMGIIPLHIHTYTTTYVGFNGANWQFNDHAMQPMEFHGFINHSVPYGFYARIMDLTTGYTTISVGDNVPAHENTNLFGWPCLQNGKINGWATGVPLDLNPAAYAYPAQFGISYTAADFNAYDAEKLPRHLLNTGSPYPYTGNNWPCFGDGQSMSAELNLIEHGWIAENNGISGGGILSIGTINYGVMNAIGSYNSAPFGDWSFVQVRDPVLNTNRHRLLFTDFASYVSPIFEAHLENPPGASLNIDLLFTDWGNGTPNAIDAGFLLISKLALTIGTVVCNGFGILVAPDYSAYYILQIIPHDTTSAGWTTMIGTFAAKVDNSGAVWMKNFNLGNTLFVSAGNVLKQLPIFFPVPLSDSADADPVVQMMRSFQP